MKRSRLVLWLLAGAMLSIAGWYAFSLFGGKPVRFRDFQTRMLLEQANLDPEWATRTGLPWSVPLTAGYLQLTDRSPAGMDQRIALCRTQLDLLKKYPVSSSNAENTAALRHADEWLTQRLQSLQVEKVKWPLYPESGEPFRLLVFLCEEQPIRNNEEADIYLSRLQWLPQALTQIEDRARKQLEAGQVPNRFLLEKTIAELRPWATLPPLEHPLYRSLAFRISQTDPTSLNQGRGMDVLQTTLTLVETSSLPAIKHLLDFLENEALPRSSQKVTAPDAKMFLDLSQLMGTYASYPIARGFFSPTQALPIDSSDIKDPWTDIEDWERKSRRWIQGIFPPEWKAPRLLLFPRNEYISGEQPLYVAPFLKPGSLGRLVLPANKLQLPGYARAQILQWGIPGVHYARATIRTDTTRLWINRLSDDRVFWEGWSLYAGWLMENELKIVTDSATLGVLEHDRRMAEGYFLATQAIFVNQSPLPKVRQQLSGQLSLNESEVDRVLIRVLGEPLQAARVWITYLALLDLRKKTQENVGKGFYLNDYHARLLSEIPAGTLQLESWARTGYFSSLPATQK